MQFVADPYLGVRRLSDGVVADGMLNGIINPMLPVGTAPVLVQQRIDATLLLRFLITIEGIARHAHGATGLRDVAQLLCRIQQLKLVFDDGLICTIPCGLLLVRFMPLRNSIKPGNPALPKNRVRTSQNQYSFPSRRVELRGASSGSQPIKGPPFLPFCVHGLTIVPSLVLAAVLHGSRCQLGLLGTFGQQHFANFGEFLLGLLC